MKDLSLLLTICLDRCISVSFMFLSEKLFLTYSLVQWTKRCLQAMQGFFRFISCFLLRVLQVYNYTHRYQVKNIIVIEVALELNSYIFSN